MIASACEENGEYTMHIKAVNRANGKDRKDLLIDGRWLLGDIKNSNKWNVVDIMGQESLGKIQTVNELYELISATCSDEDRMKKEGV